MRNIFISATTQDLKQARRHVLELVLKNGCYPIVEEGFTTEGNNVSVLRTIELKLRAADAVICLVGLHYGGEPTKRNKGSKRRSWTQIEYDVARKLGKTILICAADLGFYGGQIPDESGDKTEQERKARLQKVHYDSLIGGPGWYYKFSRIGDLTGHVASFLNDPRLHSDKKNRVRQLLYVGAQKGSGGAKFQDLELDRQLKALRKAVSNRRIAIASIFDAPPLEILKKINEVRPDILHVAGAQEAGCIRLHDARGRLVPFDAEQLADLIAGSNDGSLRLVVLDTCYSMQQAKRLTARGIPYAVGIYDAISDDVATEFYSCFYNSLASGKSLETAIASSSRLILGHAKVDSEWRQELEEILEMKFEARLHLPGLAVATGLNPAAEDF
jgi:hypothetical protein